MIYTHLYTQLTHADTNKASTGTSTSINTWCNLIAQSLIMQQKSFQHAENGSHATIYFPLSIYIPAVLKAMILT